MTEAEIIDKHKELYERSGACGLVLKHKDNKFVFNNIPNSNGAIILKTLFETELFVRGYELGYASSLDP